MPICDRMLYATGYIFGFLNRSKKYLKNDTLPRSLAFQMSVQASLEKNNSSHFTLWWFSKGFVTLTLKKNPHCVLEGLLGPSEAYSKSDVTSFLNSGSCLKVPNHCEWGVLGAVTFEPMMQFGCPLRSRIYRKYVTWSILWFKAKSVTFDEIFIH